MRPKLVAHHLEAPRRHFDFEVADAQLVRAEAAVHVERPPSVSSRCSDIDGHLVGRQRQRGARVLVARAARRRQEAAFATSTGPAKCGSRLVPTAATSMLSWPLTSRTTSVRPSIRPRLIALDLIATSIGSFGAVGVEQASGSVPTAVIQIARRLIEPQVDVERPAGVVEAARRASDSSRARRARWLMVTVP